MTICEIIKTQWIFGRAVLKTRDRLFTITIDENGDLVGHLPWRIPAHVLCGDGWELEYPQEYPAVDIIRALSELNNDLSILHKGEWGDFEYTEAREAIYAIARALNFKIEKMRRSDDEQR